MNSTKKVIFYTTLSLICLLTKEACAEHLKPQNNTNIQLAQMDPFNEENRQSYTNSMNYRDSLSMIDEIERRKAQHFNSNPRHTCRAMAPNMPRVKFPSYPHPGRFAVTPFEAQQAGVMTGCANVMFQLDSYGRTINARVVSEEPAGYGFGEAAIESLAGDRFKSATPDGTWYGFLIQVQP